MISKYFRWPEYGTLVRCKKLQLHTKLIWNDSKLSNQDNLVEPDCDKICGAQSTVVRPENETRKQTQD